MADEKITLGKDLARLLEVLKELRRTCPWDREQTMRSLAKHLIEEAYEAAGAIEDDAPEAIRDELGDLLAQVFFISIIAEEQARFDLAEICRGVTDKLVRRHPHIYGDVHATTAQEVIANWSRIKQQERRTAGAVSALSGVERAQPALMRAEKLGARTREAGMDWADIHSVLAKVREEMDEVEGALARNDLDAAAAELGDMLLALGNAPRFIGHSAEQTLRRSCDKFTDRFVALERFLAARGLELSKLTPAEIESVWQQVKREKGSKEA